MAISLYDIKISSCETYHEKDEQPLYGKRFLKVLTFHSPGLAPVLDDEGAYHIDCVGKEAYTNRFKRTFGFYDNRAAVETEDGCFHILPNGNPAYFQKYEWCGNFQEGCCPVRNYDKHYFHITLSGEPLYSERYAYVGDFKDAIAVVCNEQGLHTHINTTGTLIHSTWFDQLDVFHKGFARAKDERGWAHIDKQGRFIYTERYAVVEAFYNGIAYVEGFEGNLLLINETGKIVKIIRGKDVRTKKINELSGDMVGFWKTWTLYTAITHKIPDYLPADLEYVAHQTNIPISNVKRLFKALWELDIIQPRNDNDWELTHKGAFLKPVNNSFMASAGLMWGRVNQGWEALPNLIKASHDKYMISFKEKEEDNTILAQYQRALDGYTEKDFTEVSQLSFWKNHAHLLGFGRSSLFLISQLLKKHEQVQGTLLGSEKTFRNYDIPVSLKNRLKIEHWDLKSDWSKKADAVLFCRFLHYFPDSHVINILNIARGNLKTDGSLYIMEMVLDENTPMGGLFDLNMFVETNGKVRSTEEWEGLFALVHVRLEEIQKLSPILTLLKLSPL
jgi:hypothetical protein